MRLDDERLALSPEELSAFWLLLWNSITVNHAAPSAMPSLPWPSVLSEMWASSCLGPILLCFCYVFCDRSSVFRHFPLSYSFLNPWFSYGSSSEGNRKTLSIDTGIQNWFKAPSTFYFFKMWCLCSRHFWEKKNIYPLLLTSIVLGNNKIYY